VDVRSERIVWGKTFDDDVSNLFELQDSIADEVARTLRSPRRLGMLERRLLKLPAPLRASLPV
jgi:hypothetical protein